ncbi:MAG TPA: thiamine-binding protein [Opitutaceae bacterium]|nr:thiamine-binding protein [Opitutaceae bacterium]
MLADLSIIPIGGSAHTSDVLADVLQLIHTSGIAYQLTPTTTCLEGTWEEITAVAQRCHQLTRRKHAHVVTLLRLEDDANAGYSKLVRNVESVREKAGRPLTTEVRSDSLTTPR